MTSMMREDINIQWYPGHMTKARRMIADNLKLIDAVCEIIDARIPFSSRNPDLNEITGTKPRLIILNRVDQADPAVTKKWRTLFAEQELKIIETDCKTGRGTSALPTAVRNLLADKLARNVAKGQAGRTIRIMIAGIPNVGKSSLINRAAKRKVTQTSDKPGVTRGKQWISIGGGIELLDTPGVLWPRFDNQIVGENLAFTGAIRDDIMDKETLGANLMIRLRDNFADRLRERYKIEADPQATGLEMLSAAAKNRGFLLSGAGLDLERMASVLLDEFRAGKLGRISLEEPVNNCKDV